MRTIRLLAGVAFFAVGAWGLYLVEVLFWQEWGWVGIVVGNLLFPVALLVAAAYDGFGNGDWTLALITASGPVFWAIVTLARTRAS